MRLWHIDLIPYLPKGQLVSQWRELNSIFKKQDKHILINYIYKYSKQTLLAYTERVISELYRRNYNIRSFKHLKNYFNLENQEYPFKMWNYTGLESFQEHDSEYLTMCYYNLKEKYIRGQKDFTFKEWAKIENFYKWGIK